LKPVAAEPSGGLAKSGVEAETGVERSRDSILVVGGGVFGLTAVLEIHRRGHAVRLIDPGPLPYPLAS
jgi:heterodisulfide reductase subunit A-like polyferredoxin